MPKSVRLLLHLDFQVYSGQLIINTHHIQSIYNIKGSKRSDTLSGLDEVSLQAGGRGREQPLPLPVVQPPPAHQLLVGPLLRDAAAADDHDLIGALDGPQPVSDDQEGSAGAGGQGLLHLRGVGEPLGPAQADPGDAEATPT